MKHPTNQTQRQKRKARTKVGLKGTKNRPRLVVFRSNKYIYAQLVDDSVGNTISGVSEKDIKNAGNKEKISKTEKAKLVGKTIADFGLKKNIKEVIFDRSGYKYHGRVKALADGAREGGLKF